MAMQSDDPTPTRRRPWRRRALPLAAGAMLAAGALAIGIPLSIGAAPASAATASAPTLAISPSARGAVSGWSSGGYGTYGTYGGSGATQSGTGATATMTAATTADAAESTGIVMIDTSLGYSNAAAAGTGMVLTADGLVLTNNHVIEGSTEISVTVASTGATYAASVVGVDAADDVALLQLDAASGLQTIAIDGDAEAVGDAVTAVGNAEGGGVLMAADGSITALDATVTTAAEGAVQSESLAGMIQIVADVVSGDSGGALLDAQGEVVGMTTAASSGRVPTVAYAIPIEDALAIVQQIRNGDESGGVTLGAPAFLGVGLATTTTRTGVATRPGTSSSRNAVVRGVTIAGVYAGTPAADAGLAAGDTITAIDGTETADSTALSAALAAHAPGDRVTVSWTDAAGAAHSAEVVLIAGPAA
jgi:S1-C subfamily serine protease